METNNIKTVAELYEEAQTAEKTFRQNAYVEIGKMAKVVEFEKFSIYVEQGELHTNREGDETVKFIVDEPFIIDDVNYDGFRLTVTLSDEYGDQTDIDGAQFTIDGLYNMLQNLQEAAKKSEC